MNQNRLYVLLVVFFITTISVTNSLPSGKFKRSDDACANIKQAYLDVLNTTKNPDIKYADVKNCFESFSYNYTRASELIEIFKGLYGNFYVFLDQAKEPPQPGLDYKPLDLLKEFDNLLEKDYKSDFEFMNAIMDILYGLKDAHVNFNPLCYSGFFFDQEIYLYSVVKSDGTQTIQVYEYASDPSIKNCEVTLINGKPAFDVIVEYADTSVSSSRDLGVRFNVALASLTATGGMKKGEFGFRTRLPETKSISYDLVCSGKKSRIDIPWKISIQDYRLFPLFNDSKDYFDNLCNNPNKSFPYITDVENVEKKADSEPLVKPLLNVSTMASFYQLDEIGVVVVSSFADDNHTLEPTFPEIYNGLINGFNLLAQANVKKIVLDFTYNGGGIVEWSSFLNSLLLYKKDIVTFPGDIKVSDISKLAINTSTSENLGSLFNGHNFVDFTTQKPFNTSEEFIGNNFYNRGGDRVRFTNKFFDIISNYTDASLNSVTKLPWNPSDMIILTNGFCGSSCALTSLFLSEIGQISTVSVGGFYNKSLSFSSFAGGSVLHTDSLINELQSLKLKNDKQFSFYNVRILRSDDASFTFKEVYSIEKPDDVLEFQFRPAQYRLYYDDENSRDLTKLWKQAASLIKKT
ncbi:3240_t:CDS:2 [Acaulospora morrowiae]|uniref:3240_t:CDS:1 n=1 Tax=Acaulospora morrowiae TaxID=94023 RepID=A0A9N9AT05_9GLOM|nr:3240_t:CDS:2 [Acaulospora morrowiae]